MSYHQYVFSISISGTYDLTIKQIVNCRQNKTHSRKQVLKYIYLVTSRSNNVWTPYQGFTLDPLGALSGPLTRRLYYAYASICSSYAPDPLVHPNTKSMYGKCDVPLSSFVLHLYYLPFIVKQLPLGRQISNWDNNFFYFSSIYDMKTIYFLFLFFYFYFSFVYWQILTIYMYSSPFIVLLLCVYCLIDGCLRQETIWAHPPPYLIYVYS